MARGARPSSRVITAIDCCRSALHATAVRVVVLVAACGVEDPERERRKLARLRIAADRAVQVVAVRRELDEAALLHLARLRPREHRLALRALAADHPRARHRDDRGHPCGQQQRVDACVIARVRVVDRDEDGLLGERRLSAARAIDLVERERVPAVRDEVLEEGHEIARGRAVRVELCSLVHDVVQHDGRGRPSRPALRARRPARASWRARATRRRAAGCAARLMGSDAPG